MKRRNLLHTGIAAVLLLSTGACEDFKFGNAFLDKPFTTDITIDTVYAHKVYALRRKIMLGYTGRHD